ARRHLRGGLHGVDDRGRFGVRHPWRVLADDELIRVPAVSPPAPVVDSNGAGDAFAAGFLFGRLSGEPLRRCALYGAVAGAHACTVPATRTAPLGRDALLARAAEPEPVTR
ncbi:PfkB family carbohydrate kinase, partial [Streptomyces nodosus]